LNATTQRSPATKPNLKSPKVAVKSPLGVTGVLLTCLATYNAMTCKASSTLATSPKSALLKLRPNGAIQILLLLLLLLVASCGQGLRGYVLPCCVASLPLVIGYISQIIVQSITQLLTRHVNLKKRIAGADTV